jgi:hypothetical protein
VHNFCALLIFIKLRKNWIKMIRSELRYYHYGLKSWTNKNRESILSDRIMHITRKYIGKLAKRSPKNYSLRKVGAGSYVIISKHWYFTIFDNIWIMAKGHGSNQILGILILEKNLWKTLWDPTFLPLDILI